LVASRAGSIFLLSASQALSAKACQIKAAIESLRQLSCNKNIVDSKTESAANIKKQHFTSEYADQTRKTAS